MRARIKIDAADEAFSIYIRLRDKRCVRCGKRGTADRHGRMIVGLECSHYFGRGNETTRFDEENGDAACCGCHQLWEAIDKEEYRNFKIKQLGQAGFDRLLLRKNLTGKKDRVMAKMYWRARIKKDFGVVAT